MLILQETTKWKDNTPNHTYVVSDDKGTLFGYYPFSNTKRVMLKNPMRFDMRGRTFKTIRREKEPVTGLKTWTLKGSKGDTYIVTEENGQLSCTCPGFQFRGKCKHLEECK